MNTGSAREFGALTMPGPGSPGGICCLAAQESPGIVNPMKPALALGVPAVVLLTLVLLPPAAAQDAEPSTPETRPGAEVSFPAGRIVSKSYLSLPDTPGPHPGVLIAPEWWGHNPYVRMRADMLSKLGYAALAMDLYGEGQVADTPKAAAQLDGLLNANQREMTARVLAHLKFLAAHPEVDPGKVAAIGYGSGGDVCLQMARNGMRGLDGVVAFHPFFRVRPSNPPIRKATARVMVCDAREDPYVHLSGGKVEAFEKEMASVKTELKIVPFPDAMQSFTVPGADRIGEKFRIPHVYNAKADTRAWALLEAFLRDLWKPVETPSP